MNKVLPRPFIQTAELSDVGAAVVRSICKDLAEHFEAAFAKMASDLPKHFPEALINAIHDAAAHRIERLTAA